MRPTARHLGWLDEAAPHRSLHRPTLPVRARTALRHGFCWTTTAPDQMALHNCPRSRLFPRHVYLSRRPFVLRPPGRLSMGCFGQPCKPGLHEAGDPAPMMLGPGHPASFNAPPGHYASTAPRLLLDHGTHLMLPHWITAAAPTNRAAPAPVSLSGLLLHDDTPSSTCCTASALLLQHRNTYHRPTLLCVAWIVSA